MNEVNKTGMRFLCIVCFAALDIEDKMFDNICPYCGSTQKYNLEENEW